MRKFCITLAALAISGIALGNSLHLLQPPIQPQPGFRGMTTLCYVTGYSLDGNVGGVCKFIGYRGVNYSATVEWDIRDASPTFLAPCHVPGQWVNLGATDCPPLVYGAFEHIEVTGFGDSLSMFVKINDGAGTLAGQLDTAPRVPALVTP